MDWIVFRDAIIYEIKHSLDLSSDPQILYSSFVLIENAITEVLGGEVRCRKLVDPLVFSGAECNKLIRLRRAAWNLRFCVTSFPKDFANYKRL